MLITADENIPFAREAFRSLGTVALVPGRTLRNEDLQKTDALIVRSVTRVNAALLEGTPVRFVGTCTIGTDHLDVAYLESRGIRWVSAPGCNANSVGEYVIAALLRLAAKHALHLPSLKLGIVGAGNVGRNVTAKARVLGMQPVLNDPPLAVATGDPVYVPLEAVFECDVVTFHVPLERGGPYPTWHLADAAFLARLKPGAFVINTSRGEVVDNDALLHALERGTLRGAVLDVWEDEPLPRLPLLERVDIATPHIAGYSYDGKVNGTEQVYKALCEFLETPVAWHPAPHLPPPAVPALTLDPAAPNALYSAVSAIYDIMQDDVAMRGLLALEPSARAGYFDLLRREYPQRREFSNTRVTLSQEAPPLARHLAGLGFHL